MFPTLFVILALAQHHPAHGALQRDTPHPPGEVKEFVDPLE
jgi:hypothetical protein